MQAPTTVMLTSGPKAVLTYPITSGIKAPPDTAIISNPEISLERSGILANANEKMIGNIFPAPSPIIMTETKATMRLGAKNTPRMPTRAKSVVRSRNTFGLIQFKMMAPRKREMVSPAKNQLIPITALSSVIPYFAIKTLAILVLIATSEPTIRKMESAIKATNLLLSNLKQEANVAGLRSGLDSLIGVIESHKAARSEVMP